MKIGPGGMRLERSRQAERDLDEILTYGTRRFGHDVGDAYFFSFEAAFALLVDNPQAGEPIDHVGPGVRKLTHRRHRIFYEIDGDRIWVLRVRHHAQDMPDILRP